MTLRDALAAAIGEWVFVDHSGPQDDRTLADAILSDPAFREALVEAVADGLFDVEQSDTGVYFGNFTQCARAIVARMLGDEP